MVYSINQPKVIWRVNPIVRGKKTVRQLATARGLSPEEIWRCAESVSTPTRMPSEALQEDLHLKLKASLMLVIGAGGGAGRAAYKCADEGVQNLFLVNRNRGQGEGSRARTSRTLQGPEGRSGIR